MIDVVMDAGDAALGLYQFVDSNWNFVVSCDWQCRPQGEQTTMINNNNIAAQPTTEAMQSPPLDEKDAEIGLYQLVDPSGNFVVSCDWQCWPQGVEGKQASMTAVQPTPKVLQSKTLDENEAQIGLYQLVDPSWNFVVSCDWQCKSEDERLEELQQEEQQQQQPEQLEQLDKKAPHPPARTKCGVLLAESDARIGLYQIVDHRWNYVASCDWQCKPPRGRISKIAKTREREPSKVKEEKDETFEPSEAKEAETESVPLSEADAQLGLYQLVNPKWDYVISCDWQCRPPGETAEEMYETRDVRLSEPGPVRLSEPGPVPLSESDAQLGLYQLVNPRWNFVVSCDWQCRPLGESDVEIEGHEDTREQEVLGHEVDEEHVSTSSLSTCREDGEGEGRPSLFQQTGDIMLTLVGDEGEMGLVMLDELGSAAEMRLSPDVALAEQAAEQRKRQLAQLVRDLGEDGLEYGEGPAMCEVMYGWAVHAKVEEKPVVVEEVVQPKGKKAKKGRKEPEAPPSPVPAAIAPAPRTLPAMYGWAVRSTVPEPEADPSVVAYTPTQSHVSHVPTPTMSAAASSKHPTTAHTSATGVRSRVEHEACGSVDEVDVCNERLRQARRVKPKVRYAPATPCQFVSCGPTKPLRTFREKPDSCLPRRK